MPFVDRSSFINRPCAAGTIVLRFRKYIREYDDGGTRVALICVLRPAVVQILRDTIDRYHELLALAQLTVSLPGIPANLKQ